MGYLVADTESINVFRAAKRMSTRDLSVASGVNTTTVSGLCSGRFTRCHTRTAERIAHALGVDLDDVFVRPLEAPDDRYLTVEEAARIMRKAPRTVYRRINDHELDAVRDGRSVLIPRASFEAYMARHTIRAAT